MGVLTEAAALFGPESPHRTTAFSVLLGLTTCAAYLLFLHPYQQLVKLPFAGVRNTSLASLFLARFKFITNAKSMLHSGHMQYRDQPFQIPTYSGDRVILSPKHVEELRNWPESKLSLSAASLDFMHGRLVGLDILAVEGAPHMRVCRKELTQNLAKLMESTLDETRFALNTEFPDATDWTSINIHHTNLNIIARIAGRIFVGPKVCRNQEWLKTSVKFTEDVFSNAIIVTLLPRFIRSFASAYILPFARRVSHHRAIARKYLAPIYAERLAREKAAGGADKVSGEEDDIYTWMLAQAKPALRNVETLVDFQLILSMAALHSTTVVLVGVLYDLAARPEYMEPLREEMMKAILEDGGILKKSTLAKMIKLDSFMKESGRFNSNILSFVRKILKDITLADGTLLPANTMIAAPLRALMHDPERVPNPDDFDGFRWSKLREQDPNAYQFVSTSSSTLFFGHGNHACPGRFFAVDEIKILLVFFLLKYEFKYPEGETRPAAWEMAENVIQNTGRNLMFKKRTDIPAFVFL